MSSGPKYVLRTVTAAEYTRNNAHAPRRNIILYTRIVITIYTHTHGHTIYTIRCIYMYRSVGDGGATRQVSTYYISLNGIASTPKIAQIRNGPVVYFAPVYPLRSQPPHMYARGPNGKCFSRGFRK